VPRIAGVNHRAAVRALKKAGFAVAREGRKHIVMTDGQRIVTTPRHNPVNAYTMGGIVQDAGLDGRLGEDLVREGNMGGV
jgi:predicted RNA binding protein YcfA (HicA-like mRNA interferase family)